MTIHERRPHNAGRGKRFQYTLFTAGLIGKIALNQKDINHRYMIRIHFVTRR